LWDRHHLACSAVAEQLVRDGATVARPRDEPGVDLYARTPTSGTRVPIRVRSASKAGFGIYRKDGQVSGIVLAYVWNLFGDDPITFYAMRWPEVQAVGAALEWTDKDVYRLQGRYERTTATQRIKNVLRRHRMTRGSWLELLDDQVRGR
jgi:hypothetical protein